MEFIDEVAALYFKYNKNIKIIRDESTLIIFNHIFKNPNNQVGSSNVNLMQIGKFYIIRYNYNGNKLWCPIITIPPVPNKNEEGVLGKQLKIINNKNILYALNFDYLPTQYKVTLIDTIIKNNKNKYDNNKDKINAGGTVKEEFNFKVNWIYNFLKTNGQKNYAITAFDLSKIDRVFEISSTILDRFVFIDTYYINNRLMYDTLSQIEDEKIRIDFTHKIKMYEEILKMYEDDIEKFFKALRSFEKSLKLLDI